MQTGGTKRKIVTSTLVECEMYAEHGFDDILYGFPFIQAHLERVFALTERLEEFHLMVANKEACQTLEQATPPQGKLWSVFLKVCLLFYYILVPTIFKAKVLSRAPGTMTGKVKK